MVVPQLAVDFSKPMYLHGIPRFQIKGVANNCSAACITGMSSINGRAHVVNTKESLTAWHTQSTMRDIFLNISGPVARMPKEFAYAYVLEQIYKKATTGNCPEHQVNNSDIYRMYARTNYATKLWLFSDNHNNAHTETKVSQFCKWLVKQGVRKVGRCVESPWVDGAHGGKVKGWIYAPNLTRVKEFVDEMIAKANEHQEALRLMPGVVVKGRLVNDEVCKLW